MTVSELIGIVAPILLSQLISLLPSFAGDFLESQAASLAQEIKKAGIDQKRIEEIEQLCLDFAKGASVATAGTSTILTYVYGAIGVAPFLGNSLVWITVLAGWGLFALAYFLHVILTFNLYEIPQTFLRKPWSQDKGAFLPWTHLGGLTLVITISTLAIAAAAVTGFFLT